MRTPTHTHASSSRGGPHAC